MKPTLSYINPDCFVDTDLSVLKYLAEHFNVVWYPVYYTDRQINFSPEFLKEYASEYGIQLCLCPRIYRQRDPRNLAFYRRIVNDINSRRADLVYTCITEEIWWSIAQRRLKVPAKVLGLHDVRKHSYSNRAKRAIQSFFQGLAIRMNENICVFSSNQQSLFKAEYGRDAVNVGMSGKYFGDSGKTPGDVRDGIDLLFFGNIEKYKGLDSLIGAIERLRKKGISNLRLTIAGRGNDWDRCKEVIMCPEAFNLQIRFIENGEIPDLVCSHHFLVLPYMDATQSGPLLIAARYGIPVLAPSFGCFSELYDSESAILYDDLESGLLRASSLTSEEYASMSRNAKLVGRKCSEPAVAENFISMFKAVCSKK